MRRRSSVITLVVLTVVLAVVVAYQARRQRHVPPSRQVGARIIPPVAYMKAPARMNVVVSLIDPSAGDSVRAILERDFSNSDWLRVLSPDSSAVAIVVQAALTTKGIRVALVDGTTGKTVRSGDFPLPWIVPIDSTTVDDSLARDLAAKDAITRSLLAHNALLADSLRRVQASTLPRRQSSFWLPAPLRRSERAAVSRDSMLRVLAHANVDIRARAKRDTARYVQVRSVIWKKAQAERDSLLKEWRWAMHGVADQLTQWIAGHRGVAQSRIAYVAHKELHIVDADGENDHVVADGATIMSPSWRHDGLEIAFSQMNDDGTHIAQLDLKTGDVNFLPSVPRGMNITPVYSPDDRWIVFAHGGEHGTDLVVVPRDGGRLRRIVSGGYDNSGPAFDLRSGRIAFSSARLRTPQIYSVRIDGADERLETPIVSNKRSYRSSPDWSPDGRAIAFEQQNGNFQLWLVTLPDRELRQLTSVGENEGPSWAPDARHLAFTSTRGGKKDIWILDVESGRTRQLTTSGEARLAAWSPAGPHVLAGR